MLAQAEVEVLEQVNAKAKWGRDEALELAGQVDEIIVAKGKKRLHFDMAHDPPDDEELLAVILGRSGTLRAPTLRRQQTLLVGFNQQLYEEFFGLVDEAES